MKKLSLFLATAFMALSFSAKAQVTVVDSGSCGTQGNNLTWTLYSDSVLTIKGSGAMTNYNIFSSYYAPWYSYQYAIKTAIIGDSVTNIGSCAFYSCHYLNSITIGNSVANIGERAFTWCINLRYVTIGNNVTSIGNAAFMLSSLMSVTIENSVTSIGNDAFSNCYNLISVNIGNSVTDIGEYAFNNCSNLSSITCKAIIPPTLGSNALNGVPTTASVYVPCGTISAYQVNWTHFSNFIALVDTTFYSDTICQGENYNFGGKIYTISGTYYDTLESANGCDSVICLTLTVNDISPISGLRITVSDNSFIISWFNTPELVYEIYRNELFLDTVSSSGRTGTYIDSNLVEGTTYCYQIKAVNGNCESELSEAVCETFNIVGIVETDNYPSLRVYPNPANGQLTIECRDVPTADIQIYNVVGRNVGAGLKPAPTEDNMVIIDISHLPNGMYFLKMDNKVVKFLKK